MEGVALPPGVVATWLACDWLHGDAGASTDDAELKFDPVATVVVRVGEETDAGCKTLGTLELRRDADSCVSVLSVS